MKKSLILCLALVITLSGAVTAVKIDPKATLMTKDGKTVATKTPASKGTAPTFATLISSTGYADAWRATAAQYGKSIIVDPAGMNIGVAFGTVGAPCNLMFGYSNDGGANWSAMTIFAGTTTGLSERIYSGLALDASGLPYLVWQDRAINSIQWSKDEGGIGAGLWFTTPDTLARDSVAWYIPSLGIKGNKMIMSAFSHGGVTPVGDFSIHAVLSNDLGATWQAPYDRKPLPYGWNKWGYNEISGQGWDLDEVDWIFSPSGDTVIAFQDYVTDTIAYINNVNAGGGGAGYWPVIKTSFDGGVTWSAPFQIMSQIDLPQYSEGGWWYRYDGAWVGDRPHLLYIPSDNNWNGTALFEMHPSVAGNYSNWSINRISDIPNNQAGVTAGDQNGGWVDHPTISYDASGNIFAIYEDFRADLKKKQEIFGVASTDGGATWLNPVMLTNDTAWTTYLGTTATIYNEAAENVAAGKIHMILHSVDYANIYYWSVPTATILAGTVRPDEITLAPELVGSDTCGWGGPVDAIVDTVMAAGDILTTYWSPAVAVGGTYEIQISKTSDFAPTANNTYKWANAGLNVNYISVIGLPAVNTVWYWRVRSVKGTNSPWSAVYDFYYQGATVNTTDWVTTTYGLATPALLTPADSLRTADATPTLTWGAVGSATSYWAQVASDYAFASIVSQDTVAATSFTTMSLANSQYYWRIKAYNTTDSSDWSAIRRFTVDTVKPQIVYTAPANNATGITTSYQVKIGFSDQMNTASFFYRCNPDPGGWSAAWNAGQDTVTLTHNAFNSLTAYAITVDSVKDLAGNALTSGTTPNPFSFTTAATGAIEWVSMPAGNFTMGSLPGDPYAQTNEQPQHTVYLDAYKISKYEITNSQYKAFMDAGGYSNSSYWTTDGWSWRTTNSITEPYYWSSGSYNSGTAFPNHPVVGVSWYEAYAFCNWAGGSLPTEAQWEKAARSTVATNYWPWGSTWDASKCNSQYNTSPDTFVNSCPVGFFSMGQSPYGVYDMAGNVYEWVYDWYGSDYYSDPSANNNPTGPTTGTYRVLRGGCFWSGGGGLWYYRCAARSDNGNTPETRVGHEGFRAAKDLLIVPILNQPLDKAKLNYTPDTLEWDSVGGAMNYRLQLAYDIGFTNFVKDTSVTAFSYTTDSLADSMYFWRVKAYYTTDSSDWSQVWQFRIDTQTPAKPTSLLANGANPSSWTNNSAFSINCTNPADASGIMKYYYKTGSQPSSASDITDSSIAKPLSVTATAQGGQQVHVWLVDSAGNVNFANRDSVNMRWDNTAPSGAAASCYAYSSYLNFTVNWSAGSDGGGSGLNGNYWIKRKTGAGSWVNYDTMHVGASLADTGTQLVTYYYEVGARDSAGNVETFAGAAECSTKVDTTIKSPALVTPANGSSGNDKTPAFAWQTYSGKDTFQVQCAYNSGFTSYKFDQIIGSATAYVYSAADSVFADSVYYWRARALSTGDTTAWSPYNRFRVDTQAPIKPTALTADSANPSPWRNNAGYVINFTNPSDASGIRKYYYKVGSQPVSAIDTTGNSLVKPFNAMATNQGGQQVHVWLVDSAGNVNFANRDSVRMRYDTGSPQTSIVLGPSGTTTLDTVKFRFAGLDSAGFTDTLNLQYSCRLDSAAGVWSAYHAFRETSFVYLSDGSHKFEVRALDLAGNVDPTPAVLNFNAVALLRIANFSPGGIVLPTDSATVTFNKPVNRSQLDKAHIVIAGTSGWNYAVNDFYYLGASKKLVIRPDTAFPASDTITVTITGNLSDSLNLTTLDGNNNGTPQGSPTDDVSFTFNTGMLGDYDFSGSVNSADLTLFGSAWTSYDRRYELGPYTGTWPQWAPVINASTRLDFEDVMALAASWNNAGKFVLAAAKDGDEGVMYFEAVPGDPAAVAGKLKPGYSITALDLIVSGMEGITIKSVEPGAYWNAEGKPRLFLSKLADSEYYISAANWPEAQSNSNELLTIKYGAQNKNEGSLVYTYRVKDGQGIEQTISKTEKITGIKAIPQRYLLDKAYPNPARSQTSIVFGLPKPAQVKLEVYNVLGQRVAVLADGPKEAGYHTIQWNLRDMQGIRVSNGVYLYKLQTSGFNQVRKLTVLR